MKVSGFPGQEVWLPPIIIGVPSFSMEPDTRGIRMSSSCREMSMLPRVTSASWPRLTWPGKSSPPEPLPAGMAMEPSPANQHRTDQWAPLPFRPAPLPTRSRSSIPDARGNSQTKLAGRSCSPLLPLHPRHRCRCFETTFLTGFTGERVAGRKQGMNESLGAEEFRRIAGEGGGQRFHNLSSN